MAAVEMPTESPAPASNDGDVTSLTCAEAMVRIAITKVDIVGALKIVNGKKKGTAGVFNCNWNKDQRRCRSGRREAQYFTPVVVATYLRPLRYWILFQEPSIVEKIMEIDEYIGCAMSRFSYGGPMTQHKARCDLALRDEESMVQLHIFFSSRPFGVSPLIAGHDENGPSL
ncbi:hypothetical protein Gotur_025668 [Gossypium turneri]